MMMRRRGRGLIRAAATTAVVAGTATAVSGRVARHQDEKFAAEAYEQQAAYAAQAPAYQAPIPEEPDYTMELERLAQLQARGVISEDEFRAKKKQILGV
jgi:hypothetical protein